MTIYHNFICTHVKKSEIGHTCPNGIISEHKYIFSCFKTKYEIALMCFLSVGSKCLCSDAITPTKNKVLYYMLPPFSLLPRTLQKIADQTDAILVAPVRQVKVCGNF